MATPLAALALLGLASLAHAQAVVKCVDSDGNVTYQNAPCDRGQAGRPLEMPKAETARDDGAAWEAAAKEGKVTRGMPKRWVLRARGAPAEIRPGSTREEATEVWRYLGAQGASTLVGFAGGDVAWVREEGRSAAAAGSSPSASFPPGASGGAGAASGAAPPTATAGAVSGSAARQAPAIRGPQNRRFVIAGRYCEHVFAEIGAADREETLPAGGDAAAGRRYYFEPAPGDAAMRTVFSCVDGRVADVERTMVR